MKRNYEIIDLASGGQAVHLDFRQTETVVHIGLTRPGAEQRLQEITMLACSFGLQACGADVTVEMVGNKTCASAILDCETFNCPAFEPPPPDIRDRAPMPESDPDRPGSISLDLVGA